MRFVTGCLVVGALLIGGRPAAAAETLEQLAQRMLSKSGDPGERFVKAMVETDISANLAKLEAADPEAAAHVRETLDRAIQKILGARAYSPEKTEHGIERFDLMAAGSGREITKVAVGKATRDENGRAGDLKPGRSLLKVIGPNTSHVIKYAPARGRRAPYFSVVVEVGKATTFFKRIPLGSGGKKARMPKSAW
jgi:hypothetical protein